MTQRTPGALGAFAHATVGVANLEAALDFWVGHFGFEVAARREGADPDLAALWGIGAADISRQALVRTPGAAAGALHLVQFAHPGAPVRQDVQPFDHLPKNLDLYVRDMPARVEALRGRGVKFRSEPITSAGPGDMIFSEVHLPGHDSTNVVLLEIIGEGYDTCYNSAGFAGIGPLVTIVPDLAAEEAFYAGVLGMAITLELRLEGAAIESMLGLPAGAALLLKVYGDPAEPLGRLEVIEYQRTRGRNLFARARPPALGTLHVTYRVPDLRPLLERLGSRVSVVDHGERCLVYGAGRVVSVRSPAGFRLEIIEQRP
jgi:catechol 2,3-dioxygenase-like lactoylglutathione lyase family enzyme